jgi:hypothetical protein
VEWPSPWPCPCRGHARARAPGRPRWGPPAAAARSPPCARPCRT